MCESCCCNHNHDEDYSDGSEFTRRSFIKGGAALAGAAGALTAPGLMSVLAEETGANPASQTEKNTARIKVVFLYPLQEEVFSGRFDDIWQKEKWASWPGFSFKPTDKKVHARELIDKMAQDVGVTLEYAETIHTIAAASAFIQQTKSAPPDALLIFCFWNTLSATAARICKEVGVPSIVYHPVGCNHQLPPAALMSMPNCYYIHSYENWDELLNAFYCVKAYKALANSRILRLSDYSSVKVEVAHGKKNFLNMELLDVPGQEYNTVFDSIPDSPELLAMAKEFKSRAQGVEDVTDEYVNHGIRSYFAIQELKKRYKADGITILCLMLKQRKPCVGFSLSNSENFPCACENGAESLATLMLGRHLISRTGFMHNPDFDINRNEYFGGHCTLPLKMYGEDKPELPFKVVPFYHQPPKSACLDAQLPPGAAAFVSKFTFDGTLSAFTGSIIESPKPSDAGGCATRFRMKIDNVPNVCSIYRLAHPILYLGTQEEAKRFHIFAKMFGYAWKGNV